jgi:hypothetical protein
VRGAACLSDGNDSGPDLVEYFFRIIGAEPFDGACLNGEQGHQMLPNLPKGFGILPATNTFVVLQNSFGETRLAEFDIAGDGEPR